MPPVNSLAIAFASMISGSIFVEWMFAYPGIGYFFGYAIGNRDFTLLQGIGRSIEVHSMDELDVQHALTWLKAEDQRRCA